jgi:hypothetical protein
MTDASDLQRSITEQLDAWGLRHSPEGQAALDIAHRLAHTEDLRPAAAAALHAQLRALLVDLRTLAPEEETSDEIDELRAARDKRRREAGMA